MTASLGLAIFVSGPAQAEDQAIVIYEYDREITSLTIVIVHTSAGATLPMEVAVGAPFLDAVKALKAADCTRSDLLDINTDNLLRGRSIVENERTGLFKGVLAVSCP